MTLDLDGLDALAAAALVPPSPIPVCGECGHDKGDHTEGGFCSECGCGGRHSQMRGYRHGRDREPFDSALADLQDAADPATIRRLIELARLGAAWATVEAMLPEGWRLYSLVRRRDDQWLAQARGPWVQRDENHGDYDARQREGLTATAALRALAEALRERVAP